MTDQIHFHVSTDIAKTLTVEEYEAIERAQDGDTRLYRLRPLMARFVVDEAGQPTQHGIAMQKIGRLNMEQMAGVVKGFFEAMKGQAIPKANGNSSSSASTPADESQPG
jgi:hypothetical protein